MILFNKSSNHSTEVHEELMSIKETLWTQTEVVKRLSDDITQLKSMILNLEAASYQRPSKEVVREEIKAPIFDKPKQTSKRIKVQTVKEMYEAGKTYKYIAKETGMTLQNVKNYIARYVIERPVASDKAIKQPTRWIDITTTDGNLVTVPLKRDPRNPQEQTILNMYIEGRKVREICEFTGLTHGQCIGKLYRMVDPCRTPSKSQAKRKKKRSGRQVTCPHCKKTGSTLGMARWHFDNCKHNPNNK